MNPEIEEWVVEYWGFEESEMACHRRVFQPRQQWLLSKAARQQWLLSSEAAIVSRRDKNCGFTSGYFREWIKNWACTFEKAAQYAKNLQSISSYPYRVRNKRTGDILPAVIL